MTPFEMYEKVCEFIDTETSDLQPDERREFLEFLEADVELRKEIAETL